jgi:hypothetical protein
MFRDRGGCASKDFLLTEDAKRRRAMDRIGDGPVFEPILAPEPSTRMHLRHVYVFSITPGSANCRCNFCTSNVMLEESQRMYAKRYLLAPDLNLEHTVTVFVLYERWTNDKEVLL